LSVVRGWTLNWIFNADMHSHDSMTFISYAQNFEDVMLWRALKHVPNGFYIDVGANDPEIDSVTLAFYQRGWRGLNIEPMRQYHQRLLAQRPEDINLPVAVSDRAGQMHFYDVPDTGLSTFDPAIAQMHAAAGKTVHQHEVAVTPLAALCAAHAPPDIHFLKIDVEGLEKAVLLGMDFGKWRPWILLIEATRPQSQETSHDEWEPLVLQAGYRLAYFDGLNLYYVADEHPELLDAFKAPPNFFDHFALRPGHAYSFPLQATEQKQLRAETLAHKVLGELRHVEDRSERESSRLQRLLENTTLELQQLKLDRQLQEAELTRLRQEAGQHIAQIQHLNAAVHQAQGQVEQFHAQLVAVYASSSWRLARPFRLATRLIKNPAGFIQRIRQRFIKGPAVAGQGNIAAAAKPVDPASAEILAASGQTQEPLRELTPGAHKILRDLKLALRTSRSP